MIYESVDFNILDPRFLAAGPRDQVDFIEISGCYLISIEKNGNNGDWVDGVGAK